MKQLFKIFVEQLRDGHKEIIREQFPAGFMEVSEKDLKFVEPVHVAGEAYLAEQELILRFQAQATAEMPCIICNEPVKVPILLEDMYHAIPLEEIKSGVYDFKNLLRENILLETPAFAECHSGECPNRKEITKYLKKENSNSEQDEGYQPFADLDWDR
ncbi:MAG TPA: hypothetical protein PLC42_08325 [Parachlamydiaceae bacterium]|nr:hypothetical protein [Parachlamydiaceae bacterium]